jgi:hypothetical protein
MKQMPMTIALGVLSMTLLMGGRCMQVNRPYAAPTAEDLVNATLHRNRQLRAFRAEARMSHKTDQGLVKATVRMMAEVGKKVRFDVVSPFDTPLATLVADGKDFALIDTKQNRYFHGPASPCNLARLLRIQISAGDVLTILGGSTPVIEHHKRSISWDDRAGQELLKLEGARFRQEIRLKRSKDTWELRRSVVYDLKGRELLKIIAGKFKTISGLRVATNLKISQPIYKAALEMRFVSREVNIKLPTIAFELPPSDGLIRERVVCSPEATSAKGKPAE